MSTTAFGVVQDPTTGLGMTDVEMRHILAAQWESTGVVDGLAVTGGTTLSYAVAAGVAVCSKGASDGKTLAYFAGGSTPTVAANSASNPRIDCVWITSHDVNQGDADNFVTLGVTQGTAAATPTAPTIPTYATLLAQMVMPAGATTTANAHIAQKATVPNAYGMSRMQLDGPLVYQGTSVMQGTGANYLYLFPSMTTAFPLLGIAPSLLATNGDWNAQNIRQMTGAIQGDTGIVFFDSPVTSGALVRINWTVVGRRK